MASICVRLVLTKNLLKWGVRLISFESFGLEMVLINRLKNAGIVKPSEIQEKAIGPVMMRKNTIINAETGSGKTLCYLLPIVNRLLIDEELSTRPPYALILLPTVELCHQVADMFRNIAGPRLQPCIVHKDERLQLSRRHHVVMATPNALLSYRPSVLENVQIVVTDEADFMITSGGKDVWTLLNYLKAGGKRSRNTGMEKRTHGIVNERSWGVDESGVERRPQRHQFVFVAATLPSRGRKAAYNKLRKWLPDAEVVTSSQVHQTVPGVKVEYVEVKEELKLPMLLRCLNSLAGFIVEKEGVSSFGNDRPGMNRLSSLNQECDDSEPEHDVDTFARGENVGNSDGYHLPYKSSFTRKKCEGSQHGYGVSRLSSAADQLSILVFTNSARAAARTYQFLDGIQDEEADIPWLHVTKGGRTTTSSREGTTSVVPELPTLRTGDRHHWKGKCGQLHKDVPLRERINTLEKFQAGELKVLVCTDLAARGLDIPNVSHVIQLDFAPNAAQVLHRTGRTARAGATGTVINFITNADEDLARAVSACETGPSAAGYQPTFSRNRMFRRRVKAKKLPLSELHAVELNLLEDELRPRNYP